MDGHDTNFTGGMPQNKTSKEYRFCRTPTSFMLEITTHHPCTITDDRLLVPGALAGEQDSTTRGE